MARTSNKPATSIDNEKIKEVATEEVKEVVTETTETVEETPSTEEVKEVVTKTVETPAIVKTEKTNPSKMVKVMNIKLAYRKARVDNEMITFDGEGIANVSDAVAKKLTAISGYTIVK